MKKSVIKICLVVFLIACRALLTQANEFDKGTNLRLYVFDCGYIHAYDMSIFDKRFPKGTEQVFENKCYLIQHEKGMLMWDAGIADSYIDSPKGVRTYGGKGLYTLHVRKTLASQLEEIQVDPRDIDLVAFSHMHYDHVGNAHLFNEATVLIQEEEYEVAFGKEPDPHFYNPKFYKDLQQAHIKKLKSDYDVFGDGRVVILKAPGHTLGHQVLNVNLNEYGSLVLAGDLQSYSRNRDHEFGHFFEFNKGLALKSLQKINKLLEEKNGILLNPHSAEQDDVIPYAPNYIE